MMATFRTAKSEAKYQKLAPDLLKDGCPLCLKNTIKAFAHWRIVKNEFPYDRIAQTHDMIVPLRHVSERELSEAEKNELRSIKETYLSENYEYMIEPTLRRKSIPAHFHLHLIVSKD